MGGCRPRQSKVWFQKFRDCPPYGFAPFRVVSLSRPNAVSNRLALMAPRCTASGAIRNRSYTRSTRRPNRGRPAGQEIPAPQKKTTCPSSCATNRRSGISGPFLMNCIFLCPLSDAQGVAHFSSPFVSGAFTCAPSSDRVRFRARIGTYPFERAWTGAPCGYGQSLSKTWWRMLITYVENRVMAVNRLRANTPAL